MTNVSLRMKEGIRHRMPDGDMEISDAALLVLVAFNLVTTVGLAGDIARHLQTPGDLEGDFLSSWHLVLYGGVMAVAIWLGVGAMREGPGFVVAAGATTIGFALLAFGGLVDSIWHEKFGVEASIDALVSPPHLLVFAGLAFMLTSPIAVLWRRPARRLGVAASVIVLVSVVTMVLVTSLFIGFLSPLASGMSLSIGYVEPVVGESPIEYDQVRGLGIAVWTTAMLVAAFTVVMVRFRPVSGLTGFAVFMCGAPALVLTDPEVVLPVVVGYGVAGVAVETLLALLGKPTLGQLGAAVTGAAMGGLLWASAFAMLSREDRLFWTTPMWSGTVMLAAMVGAATASLVALPAPTGDAVADSALGAGPA